MLLNWWWWWLDQTSHVPYGHGHRLLARTCTWECDGDGVRAVLCVPVLWVFQGTGLCEPLRRSMRRPRDVIAGVTQRLLLLGEAVLDEYLCLGVAALSRAERV